MLVRRRCDHGSTSLKRAEKGDVHRRGVQLSLALGNRTTAIWGMRTHWGHKIFAPKITNSARSFRPALRYGGSFRKGGKARENAQKLPRGNVLIGLRQFAHFSNDLSSNRLCWSIKIKIAASIDFVEDVSQSRSCATMKKWLCQALAFLHSVFRILYFMIFKMNFLSGYFYK
jgi:hypothetical protein